MNATDRVICGGSSPAWRKDQGHASRAKGTDRPLSRFLLLLAFAGTTAGMLQVVTACPAQAPTDRLVIADVIPQVIPPGSQTIPNQKIMSYIRTRPGVDFDPETVSDDVRRLYETRLFADIRVLKQPTSDNKVIVYFQLKELPGVIKDIVYRGAHHLKNDDLESATGLKKG